MKLLDLKYEKYKLNNGLEVILHQNKNLPIVTVNIWYKVGSAYEQRGKTGLAHLFEHMMFQGSQNAEKEMHFRLIQEAGGILNGSTTFDRTNYFEKLPSNHLELALWLEADRMGFLLPSLNQEKLDNQKGVVLNERLERYENQPYGLAWEKLLERLFPSSHPYSWPTIGYTNDIKSYTLEDVINFFDKYYAPSNACLVAAGDFELSYCKNLIEKYFSEIKGNESQNHRSFTTPLLHQNIEFEYEDNVQLERIYLAWHTDKAFSVDDPALDIFADILTGSKNSRLHKKLVFEDEIAQDINAMQVSGQLSGFFLIATTAKPGKSIKQIKDEIFKELYRLQSEGVTENELLKSKNSIKMNFINSLERIDNIADLLNSYNFFLEEPNSFLYDLFRYEQITSELVTSAFKKYLAKPFVQLTVTPFKKNKL